VPPEIISIEVRGTIMTRAYLAITAVAGLCLFVADASGRGFGGFGGGRGFGGFGGGRSFDFGGERSFGGGSFGASHYGSWDEGGRSFSDVRTTDAFSGYRGWGGTSSYDRSFTGERGGSIDTEGTRGAFATPWGGAAGGTRDTTVTGPEGRSYSGSSARGVAVGPYGRVIGGGEHTGTFAGPRGTATSGWQSAFAGNHFATDFGLSHYAGVSGALGHSTTFWSQGAMTTRAAAVRRNFPFYNTFHPGWYTAHPGAWYVAAWRAGAAWNTTPWGTLTAFAGIPAQPISYDYGDNIVLQDNNVYMDGQQVETAPAYGQQIIAQADQGVQANAPPDQEWKPLGIFSLVPGNEQTSNNTFQLAINKDGIIRGNFYDGVMDKTTPVYGTVDKKTQRAAWTIGKKSDRTFEAGLYNLTRNEAPVLLHIGTDRTEQMLLVRVPPQKQ
jgi:hypothetical protein